MAPVGFLARLKKSIYTAEMEPKIPPFSSAVAITLLVVYTLIYVIPFYLSPTTRPSPSLSRDVPSVIRGRIQSVTVSCIMCSVTTFIILAAVDDGGDLLASPFKALQFMGYIPVGLLETAKSVTLTAILFLGPLFEAGVVEGGWRDWIRLRGVDAVIHSWIGWRNFVAGPITEEVLFRSASVPLLLLSQTPNTKIIFLTPIVFGVAHVHHFYEFRITHPHTPVIGALLRSLLQFTYTTLFGGYATFIYLRTGSLLGVILVHAFCNWMGFPRFWGRLSAGESVIGPDVGERKRSEDSNSQASNAQLSVVWTVAYYVLLAVGAFAWWKLLWVLTESKSALAVFQYPSKTQI